MIIFASSSLIVAWVHRCKYTEKISSKASASKANHSLRHVMKSPNNFALTSLLKKFAYKASHYKANLSLRHNFLDPLINFYLPGRHSDFFSIEKENENRDKRVKSELTDRYKKIITE